MFEIVSVVEEDPFQFEDEDCCGGLHARRAEQNVRDDQRHRKPGRIQDRPGINKHL